MSGDQIGVVSSLYGFSTYYYHMALLTIQLYSVFRLLVLHSKIIYYGGEVFVKRSSSDRCCVLVDIPCV
jgi:hypothetical protein